MPDMTNQSKPDRHEASRSDYHHPDVHAAFDNIVPPFVIYLAVETAPRRDD